MSLEGLGPAICEVSADLTAVTDVETVKFVKPVRDGLKERHEHGHLKTD